MKNSRAPYVLTKFDPLSIIIQESPRSVELLSEYGIHCVSCIANEFDTLQTGALMHGMTEQDMDDMIDEINTELEKEWIENSKSKITNLPAGKAGHK